MKTTSDKLSVMEGVRDEEQDADGGSHIYLNAPVF